MRLMPVSATLFVALFMVGPAAAATRQRRLRPRSAIARWTGSGTTSRTPRGARPGASTCASRRPPTPTGSPSRPPARPRATSATASSTTSGRTSSPRTASPSGAGPGASSSTTPSGCARRRAASARRSPSTAHDPLEAFTQRLRRDRLLAHAGGARHRRRRTPRQQINTVSSYIDALGASTATTDARLDWLREGPSTATSPTTGAPAAAGRLLPRRRRGNAAAAPTMELKGRLDRHARRRRWSPATCAPTRTSR